jgi:peptide/nickel transport system substrate-binding protein
MLCRFLIAFTAIAAFLLTTDATARTLRWANDGDVITADPHSRNEAFVYAVMGNVYEGLIRRGRNFELEPALATEWKLVAPDTWRFKLREGVRFHDGSPFDAEDVLFSYQRARGPGSDVGNYLATVAAVKKIDAHTVDFVTAAPNPILPDELPAWYIMSRKWSEKHHATVATNLSAGEESFANRNANGTGPYKLVEKVPDVRVVLERNPDWWGRMEGNVDTAIFNRVANAATRVAALLSGDLDMIYSVPVQDIDRIAHTPGFVVLKTPELRVIFLGMDQARDELLDSNIKGANPFKDVRVRKAVYQAIDGAAIQSKVMRNLARPTALMVAKEVNGYDPALDERPPYDVEAAKLLLSEAGYPNGFTVGMDCPNDRYINDEAICQAVVAMLARVGINAKLLAQPRAKYFAKVNAPRYETSFFLLGWTPTSADAHNSLQNLIGTRDPARNRGQYNNGGYSNAHVDELIDRIQVEIDPGKRQSLISEAMRIHRDEIGHIPLHQQPVIWAAKAGIKLVQLPNAALPLWRVSLP